MTISAMNNFYQRVTVSLIATFLIALAVYLSAFAPFKLFFVGLTAAAIATALAEFYALAQNKGYKPLFYVGIIATAAYTLTTFYTTQNPGGDGYLLIAVLLATLLGAAVHFTVCGERPLDQIAMTLFGVLYVVVPLAFVINITYFFDDTGSQDGRLWLLYLFLVTKMTDVGGYTAGKMIGGPKLAPYISPNKTVAGALAGLAAATAASAFYCFLAVHFHWSFQGPALLGSLLLGFVMGVLAQLGDLVESLLKRDGGIKDSSSLPGLGGILDMADSLIFTAPLLYFYLRGL
jgi:phosphatidate cytidylyltransferase